MPVSTATNSNELAKLENTLDMYKECLQKGHPLQNYVYNNILNMWKY